MGIFLDTVEDNSESEGWRVESIRKKWGVPPSTPRIFPDIRCPLCQQGFFYNTDLQNHIFSEHRDYYNIQSNSLIQTGDKQLTENDFQELNFTDLNEVIFELQKRIDKGNRIDNWASYKAHLHCSNEHPLRKQYLKGMLEYLGAHYQEINEHSSNNQSLSEQFGRAYGYLQPFPFPLAQQVCYLIALKMNWFGQLAEVPNYSLFFWAGQFFENNYYHVATTTLPQNSNRQTEGIIIDYFHQEFLEAIQLYYCNRSTLNYNWLLKLERLLGSTSNPNYKNKLALLQARLFREWGEVEQARQAYRNIINHPIFGEEAKTFYV
jgi:hypothetical protein